MASMNGERLNPVGFVSGAARGAGFACASVLAEFAEGGLILADENETALSRAADGLERPPERVSTLAFPPGDPRRWEDVVDFIATHYGRLDWTVIAPPPPPDGGLADLDTPLLALQALATLLGENHLGGVALLVVDAHTVMKASLLQVLRQTAHECARSGVRFNTLVWGAGEAPAWRSIQTYRALDQATIDVIQRLSPPVARVWGYRIADALPALLSDAAQMEGVALVVDEQITL